MAYTAFPGDRTCGGGALRAAVVKATRATADQDVPEVCDHQCRPPQRAAGAAIRFTFGLAGYYSGMMPASLTLRPHTSSCRLTSTAKLAASDGVGSAPADWMLSRT